MGILICMLYLAETILSNNPILIVPCPSPISVPEVTHTLVDTNPPDARHNEEETHRVTTTDIQSSSGQRKFNYIRYIIISFIFIDPSEWSTETVLGWFQSHKLDEYVDSSSDKQLIYFIKLYGFIVGYIIRYLSRMKLKMVKL
jgi:hypothetical protein